MSHKLYILTRSDISPEQQAVQAGHAIADFCQKHQAPWTNGTLVYLQVPGAPDLIYWKNVCHYNEGNNRAGNFYDPDLHEGPTAMYAYGPKCEELFSDLPLMKFDI